MTLGGFVHPENFSPEGDHRMHHDGDFLI